jgi:CubicO group peptidase (beta-lactamase class C family)
LSKLLETSFVIVKTFPERKTMKKLVFTLTLLLFSSGVFQKGVFAQSIEDKVRAADAYAQEVIKRFGGPGMAIAIVKDDKVVLAKGYGTRELGKDAPVDENTVFAIASNSKAFTTASLAILVDEGKISWDDKVSKYLTDFRLYDPWVTSELTIRDLVTHRVGLDTFSGDLLWYETTYSPDEILRRVRYLKPVSGFRTTFGYQNLMFIAAGKVIEKVSGRNWCDFVTERILKPLDMRHTVCSVSNLPENAAFPHNESGGKLRVLHRGNVDGAYSAAALNSSVSDLAKWIRLQLGGGLFEGKRIFSAARGWEMHQPYLAQQISEPAFRANPTRHFSGVGLGWFVYDYYGRKIINHSGGLDGMLSYTVLIPEENAGFVVLTNSESPAFAVMMSKIRDLLVNAPERDLIGEAADRLARQKAAAEDEIRKQDAARKTNTKTSLPLNDYAGTYRDTMYGDITISQENGRLVMRFLPAPNFVADLEHWQYDTFVIKWRPSVAYNFPRGFVTFTIDRNGRPEELKIDQPNNDFWFYELSPRRVQ